MINRISNNAIIDTQSRDALRQLIDSASRVAIVCHMAPDGDAMGSSLCLCDILRQMGKHAVVITPDAPPSNLTFLPGAESIVVASYNTDTARRLLRQADLLFCLDFNMLYRIDRLQPLVEDSPAHRVVIDHHLGPDIAADVVISHPEVSSTCALLYMVLNEMDLERYITHDAAECCCLGMMTDTGNFAYNSNDPRLYLILARLIEKGVDKDALYTRVFNTNSLNRLRIMGYAQSQRMMVFERSGIALTILSVEDLKEFGYSRGDTESLVNVPLSMSNVRCSIYLRQDREDFVKVSMRSKGDFSVREICEEYFGGGGHVNAAGGEFDGSLSQALDVVLRIVDRYTPDIDK